MAGPSGDSGTGAPPLPLPGTDSAAGVPGPVFNPQGQTGSGPQSPGPVFPGDSEDGGEPQGSIEDNAPGYVPEGHGADELDPDGDGALRPLRVASVLEGHEERVSAGDGGYKLDPEAMRALLPRWKNVADKLEELRLDAEYLLYVSPPAGDEASTRQIEATYQHQHVYASIVSQQHQYAREYVSALERAINEYEQAETAAGDAARGLGGDL